MTDLTPHPDTPPAAPAHLAAKLAGVMAQVARVAKRGYNDFHRYSYGTEADITAAVRQALADARVFAFPTVRDVRRESTLNSLWMDFTFVDGDTGESWTVSFPGQGDDKGVYKAMTGALKYCLLKTFLIPTGDDPEGDTDTDRRHAAERPGRAAHPTASAPRATAPDSPPPADAPAASDDTPAAAASEPDPPAADTPRHPFDRLQPTFERLKALGVAATDVARWLKFAIPRRYADYTDADVDQAQALLDDVLAVAVAYHDLPALGFDATVLDAALADAVPERPRAQYRPEDWRRARAALEDLARHAQAAS